MENFLYPCKCTSSCSSPSSLWECSRSQGPRCCQCRHPASPWSDQARPSWSPANRSHMTANYKTTTWIRSHELYATEKYIQQIKKNYMQQITESTWWPEPESASHNPSAAASQSSWRPSRSCWPSASATTYADLPRLGPLQRQNGWVQMRANTAYMHVCNTKYLWQTMDNGWLSADERE